MTSVKFAVSASPTLTAPSRRSIGPLLLVGALLLFAIAPLLPMPLPGVLPGAINSPGSLVVLGISLVYAGLAVSYDIVFGYTGLLSLGHALFFALGVYGTELLMIHAELPFFLAAAVAVLGTATAAAAIGAIALRARGIAFAMVTLAFAEALSFFLLSDPLRITGGEEGLALVSAQVPSFLRGVANVKWVYLLALGYLVLVLLVAAWAVGTNAGRVWQAIRENEDRVEMLGLGPRAFSLVSFTLGGTLSALGGGVFLLLTRGASPSVASLDFTLALVVMVVLGGAGRLWGAAIGGFVYGMLTLRLGSLATSGAFSALPDSIERTLSEPLFLLGVIFILVVLFAPGGIAGIPDRIRGLRTRRAHRGGAA